LLIGIS